MAFFYIKHDGTATGDGGRYATQQTVSFGALGTAGYYSSLEAAVSVPTTGYVPGDDFCFSHLHNNTYTPAGNITVSGGVQTGAFVGLYSVDDNAADQYKPGAREDITTTIFDFEFQNNVDVRGMQLVGDDSTVDTVGQATIVYLQDCSVVTGTTNADVCITQSGDGSKVRMVNVNLAAASSINNNNLIQVANGGTVEWLGGEVVGNPSNIITNTSFGAGGGTVILDGISMASCTGTGLVATTAGGEDTVNVNFKGCRWHPDFTPFEAMDAEQHQVAIYNCDDTTSGKLHRFEYRNGMGVAINNDSVYVTDSPAMFGGSDKFSIQISTDADTNSARPFAFKLPAQYVDLASTTTDKLTFNLIADNQTLTDADIAVFLDYPDGTTAIQRNWVTNVARFSTIFSGIDPYATGSTLASSTLDGTAWTGTGGLTAPKYYKMELDTSGDAGQKTVVHPRIEVYTSSLTGIYLNWQIGLS